MVFYQQKVLFKGISFCVLRRCFLTMPAVNKHSQKIQRLEFANAYRHWDEDEWKQVMFSDESQESGGVED
jgi:hypothetical protein